MSKFSSWFSRLRSSSKHFYGYRTAPTVFNGHRTTTSLLPLALAISAGSLALQPHFNPSFCDNDRGVTVGGKGSTQLVVKGSKKEIPPELLQELRIVCQDDISLDYDERYNHGKPQNSFHKAVNIPDVIVYPRSEEEVSKIVKLCNDHKVPIVPYGGATSIEGHTLSPHGGVCIDMSSMKPSHKILPLL